MEMKKKYLWKKNLFKRHHITQRGCDLYSSASHSMASRILYSLYLLFFNVSFIVMRSSILATKAGLNELMLCDLCNMMLVKAKETLYSLSLPFFFSMYSWWKYFILLVVMCLQLLIFLLRPWIDCFLHREYPRYCVFSRTLYIYAGWRKWYFCVWVDVRWWRIKALAWFKFKSRCSKFVYYE